MNTDNIVEFITDPLRLTLIVAGVVVLLAILILGRRSSKRDMLYTGSPRKDYSFGSVPDDMLVDEEVIVLPPRKKESDLNAETTPHFSANYDEPAANVEAFEAKPKQQSEKISAHTPEVRSQATAPVENPAEEKAEAKQPQAATQTAQASKPPPTQKFVALHIIAAEGRPFTGRAIFDATQTLGMAMGKHNVFHYPADSAYVGDSAFCMANMSAEGNFDLSRLDEIQTNGVSLILSLPTIYSDGLTVFSNMLAVAQALSKKLGGDIIDQSRMPLTAELVTSMRADIQNFESQLRQQSPVMES